MSKNDKPAKYHALKRTNPKGQPFVGVCIQCGRADLPMSAAQEECENPAAFTEDESLLAVIGGQTHEQE